MKKPPTHKLSKSRLALLLAFFTTQQLFTPRLAAQEQAMSADALVESIGINTHFRYDNVYNKSNWPKIKAKLSELGVRYVREGCSANEGHVLDFYKTLYTDHGIKTILAVTNRAGILSVQPNQVPGMITENGRTAAFEAVEGPNEVDIFDIDYTGSDRWQRTRNYMNDLKAALNGNSSTSGIPIVAPAMANPDGDRFFNNESRIAPITHIDFANMHYYTSGHYPGFSGYLEAWKYNRADKIVGNGNPTKPYYCTESGFATSLGDARGVSEKAQAKYVNRMVAEHFKNGIFRTCLYELMDEGSDDNNFEAELGIVYNNFTNKPAFTALKNLISLLQESGSNIEARRNAGRNFIPGKLDYTVIGGPTTKDIQRLLLQKSDGTYFMLLWQRVSSFDLNSKTDLDAAAVNLTFRVKPSLRSVTTYTFADNGTMNTNNTSFSNGQFNVSVTDRICVVKIHLTSPSTGKSGNINQEVWTGIPGQSITAVPNNSLPNQVTTINQLQSNYSGDEYALKIRGYIIPPATGRYTFYLSSDDNGQFWLSRNSSVSDLTLLANVATWLPYDSFVNSESRYLVKGNCYYFLAFMKEAGGGDHLRVQWEGPGVSRQVIQGSALAVDNGISFRSDFNDLNGLIHQRTQNWAIDTALPDRHRGDGARARRTTDTTESLTFKLNGMQSFRTEIQYGADNGVGLDYSKLKFHASPDGSNWTEISATAREYFYNAEWSWFYDTFEPVGTLPHGTNFLKVEFQQGLNRVINGYDQGYGKASAQLSYIELIGGSGVARNGNGNGNGIKSGSVYRLVARHSGKVLDVSYASTEDGANVQQYPWNGSTAQRWKIELVASNYYKLTALCSGKVLDVTGRSTADGANIQQWSYNGGDHQHWYFEDAGSGYYRIVSKLSSKVVDVSYNSTADGANVFLWSNNGGSNQQFKLELQQ